MFECCDPVYASVPLLQVLAHVPPMQRERVAQLLMMPNYLRKLLDIFRVSQQHVSCKQHLEGLMQAAAQTVVASSGRVDISSSRGLMQAAACVLQAASSSGKCRKAACKEQRKVMYSRRLAHVLQQQHQGVATRRLMPAACSSCPQQHKFPANSRHHCLCWSSSRGSNAGSGVAQQWCHHWYKSLHTLSMMIHKPWLAILFLARSNKFIHIRHLTSLPWLELLYTVIFSPRASWHADTACCFASCVFSPAAM
jgi:hypothetical protein